jgi:hypothetical protein
MIVNRSVVTHRMALPLAPQLIPNYELQTLLALEPEVKVLESVTLREELKELLGKWGLYEEVK